jgi:hypothetical protein
MGSESEDAFNHRHVKWATTVIAQAKTARIGAGDSSLDQFALPQNPVD